MWRLIGLFSLIAIIFAQQITKEFEVKVEFIGELREEKPKLSPPEKLTLPRARELNLFHLLLEAPKGMEFVSVKPVEKRAGLSCGEPKDSLSYRLGVDYYLRGRYDLAEEEFGKVIVMSNSPFKPMAEYILGIIAYSKGQRDRALELFKSSCQLTHLYRDASCEAYYAFSLMLRGSVPENQNSLWKAVKDLKEGREATPSCEGVVFSQYCQYVLDFAQGRENLLYRDSTLLRSGILNYFLGELQKAKGVFSAYSGPGNHYRDIALYYLALMEYKEGRGDQALRYASILESINPSLSKELYAFISERDVYLSRLAYALTKDNRFLEKAGIIAYNSGDYPLALLNFLEAGNTRYTVYSAVGMGDYKRVIELLDRKKVKDREDYLWLLEALYWSGEDMSKALSEAWETFPELYKEYAGWERFRKGDWLSALDLFEDTYYRALALYNLKRYKEVIELLQGRTEQRSKLLRARSALMLGDTALARSLLTDETEEELYLMGMSYFLEGNYSKSASFFERITPTSPLRAKALLRAGNSYYNLGNLKLAKERYYEILRNSPHTQEAKEATLALLDFAGKELSDEEMEKLIADFMQRERQPPAEILYQYALLKIKKGDKAQAEKELIKLLDTPLKFKAILRLAELEEDPPKRLVLYYKVYKESPLEEERRKARDELVKMYTLADDKKSLADLLAEGENQDKVKAIGLYLGIRDMPSALSLARELIEAKYGDSEFESYLLELYRQSGEVSLLDYLTKSADLSLRGQALYLHGLELSKGGDKRKALENFVEISLNHRGEPYYNPAVLEGAKILLEFGARRDASCMLERFDLSWANPEDVELYKRLKEGLPRCEVN
ncbi:MAG: tetratricopeptide repeat protein [Aquificaceae bacterium]